MILAKVPRHGWFIVDKIYSESSSGDWYFIGIGMGFDIRRLAIQVSGSVDDALEAATEKWPSWLMDKISMKEAEEYEESGMATVYYRGKGCYIEKEDIRILARIDKLDRFAKVRGRQAYLSDGQTVDCS